MTIDVDKYGEACRRAATAQGLDPLTAAAKAHASELEAAGLEYYVEQTGGFTMVATFNTPERVITCTWEGQWLVMDQPVELWISGEYTGDYAEDGITDLSDKARTPEAIVALAIERARS